MGKFFRARFCRPARVIMPAKADARHRPYFLTAPGRPPSVSVRAFANRGRAERQGSSGPTGLDASRHRGLSSMSSPQVRLLPGVPRAVFIGLLRAAPGGLTVSGDPSLPPKEAWPPSVNCQAAYPPLSGPGHSGLKPRPVTGTPSTGPSDARIERAGTERLGPPEREKPRRISDAPFRPPLPAPHLKMLHRHPSNGAGWKGI
jgi:hypothetical protein